MSLVADRGTTPVSGNVAALCGAQAGHIIQAGGYAAGPASVCAVHIVHQTSRDGYAVVLQNGHWLKRRTSAMKPFVTSAYKQCGRNRLISYNALWAAQPSLSLVGFRPASGCFW